MKLDLIKEYVKTLKNMDYRNFFGAFMVFEKIDYLHELEDLNEGDMEYLDGLYEFYMEKDYFCGLRDTKDIEEMYDDYIDELEEDED